MSKFTSYFLAVPLPVKIKYEYEQLLKDVGRIDSTLELASPKTPHITFFYITKEADIGRVEKLVKELVGSLKGLELEIGGWDFFRPGNPKVLFLSVKYPAQLTKINQLLSRELTDFSAEENKLEFHPHLTIGQISKPENFSIDEINNKLPRILWSFPITEVAVFGADSTQHPEFQSREILVRI